MYLLIAGVILWVYLWVLLFASIGEKIPSKRYDPENDPKIFKTMKVAGIIVGASVGWMSFLIGLGIFVLVKIIV